MKTFISDRQYGSARTTLLLLTGMGIGYLCGAASAPSRSAHAEVTEEPRREAFKAGSLVNEPVLREMSETLKRIENHVSRIPRTGAADAETTPPRKTPTSLKKK